MQSNKAITVIYLCSLRENHFTEAVLHLTKPNSIVTPAFNDFPGSGSHQGIGMAFPNKTVSLDRVRVLYSKWTVKVLAQDQFLLYMPLKLFYFILLVYFLCRIFLLFNVQLVCCGLHLHWAVKCLALFRGFDDPCFKSDGNL